MFCCTMAANDIPSRSGGFSSDSDRNKRLIVILEMAALECVQVG